MPNDAPDLSDKPVLTLIQRLQDGSLNPATLAKEERQQCVEALLFEGYSPVQISQLVSRSEKTIKRDLADIRLRNALIPSLELAKQLVGNFLIKVEAHQTRLMRLARGNDGSVSERTQAEYSAWRVLRESMELLQTLGYLPARPLQIAGDVMHHLSVEDGERSLEEIDQTIQEIETVGQEAGALTPEIARRVHELQLRLEKAKLGQDAQRLLEQQKQLTREKENADEKPRQ